MTYWQRFTEEELQKIYQECTNPTDFCKRLGYSSSNGLAIKQLKEKYDWFHSYSKPSKKNLIGQIFGKLTVIEEVPSENHKSAYWKCQCSCGNVKNVSTSNLISGRVSSCGCYNKLRITEANLIDLTGKTFGKWTVLRRAEENSSNNSSRWICQCSCDKHTVKTIDSQTLRRGESLSCGCWHRSQGELKIAEILDELKIPYIQEYVLPNIKSAKDGQLRVDFAIIKIIVYILLLNLMGNSIMNQQKFLAEKNILKCCSKMIN